MHALINRLMNKLTNKRTNERMKVIQVSTLSDIFSFMRVVSLVTFIKCKRTRLKQECCFHTPVQTESVSDIKSIKSIFLKE